ncbi:MAG: hypothetical protein M1823_005032 [Watsoniomyces obsoletus]|nr:MAG: hypothetical protein M1823_005032 [Watsoniomyces obsoletus]
MAAMTAIHQIAAVGRDVLMLDKESPATDDGQTAAPATTKAVEKPAEREENPQHVDANVESANKDNGPMSPSETVKDPAEKALGRSSKGLRLDDFELMRTLGTGTFARVWLARLSQANEVNRNKVFALKVLRKADVIRLKQVEHVRNERAVLAAVAGHPFIATLIATFSDQDCLYMLMEYCPGGEIFTYLRHSKLFDVPTARFYAAEILLILEFLHETLHVVFRDLKPENLLLDAEGHIKLVDFGFARNVAKGSSYSLCGTPEYLAPETIESKGHNTAVDWWAFGILLYEFLVGQPPFWDQSPVKMYEKILHDPVRFPKDIDPDAKDLIRGLCTVDRSRRLGNLSGGAKQVKQHAFFKEIDWAALYARKQPGPIIPRLSGAPDDTSNFDEYPDEKKNQDPYTEELRRKFEDSFKDF